MRSGRSILRMLYNCDTRYTLPTFWMKNENFAEIRYPCNCFDSVLAH